MQSTCARVSCVSQVPCASVHDSAKSEHNLLMFRLQSFASLADVVALICTEQLILRARGLRAFGIVSPHSFDHLSELTLPYIYCKVYFVLQVAILIIFIGSTWEFREDPFCCLGRLIVLFCLTSALCRVLVTLHLPFNHELIQVIFIFFADYEVLLATA